MDILERNATVTTYQRILVNTQTFAVAMVTVFLELPSACAMKDSPSTTIVHPNLTCLAVLLAEIEPFAAIKEFAK